MSRYFGRLVLSGSEVRATPNASCFPNMAITFQISSIVMLFVFLSVKTQVADLLDHLQLLGKSLCTHNGSDGIQLCMVSIRFEASERRLLPISKSFGDMSRIEVCFPRSSLAACSYPSEDDRPNNSEEN